MKKLIQAVVVLAIMTLFPALGFAKPLTMDEALEGVCRVNTSEGRGSGTVFQEDEDKYYILTNGHVVGRARRGHVEFFQDGYKSAMIPFKTEYTAYEDGTALDLSIISVKKKYFGHYPPRVIPLAPKGTPIKANDLIIAGGCPSAQWACSWKGRVIRNHGATVSFNAAPIGGQSGSGVLINVKDSEGELQTRIGILLAWRVGDGAWTDDGPTDYGAGLSLKQIYAIIEGDGQGHPIEASYNVVYEKDETKKSAKERLNQVCPHCGHKISDHVVIPKDGGLRRTKKGEFMFCPELKFQDGGIADTARYYGGIRVGELYEGNGLFPWCPFNRCPPPNPNPNPNPQPPDNGGGFNGWPGRPDPGDPVDPPPDFDKERQEYLDKITELKEKLTNLEALSESLKAELSGTNSSLLDSQNEVNGLRDLLGTVEGQKDTLKSRIDQLLGFIVEKDGEISNLKEGSGHYMDDVTGGNGNTVENVSFTLGGASLGMLALKYGVPFLLNRRRRRRKEEEDEKEIDNDREEGYNIDGDASGCSEVEKHIHEHEHIHNHKHSHDNEYVMPLESLPQGKTTNDIDKDLQQGGLHPGFAPYGGLPVVEPHYQQVVAAHGLPPQFLNVPFSTRKQATAEQIMTIFGELVNEYQNDQTMTMNQIDTLLRQRLKEKFNIE
jgi:hypothetical protein